MKISRINRSIHGAILFSQLPPTLCLAGTSQSPRTHNGCCGGTSNTPVTIFRYGRATCCPRASISLTPSRFFTTVIATSGKRLGPDFFTSYLPRSWNGNHNAASRIDLEGSQEPIPNPRPNTTQSKHEMLGFVPQYDDTTVDEYLEEYRDPYRRKYAPANGPKLTVSDRREDVHLQSVERKAQGSRSGDEGMEYLREAIYAGLRNRAKMDLDTIWALYQAVPEPRVVNLSAQLRHALLAVLGKADRNSKSMLRYFSVVADVKQSGFSLTSFEWNTAISFAARYVAVTTEVEVGAALRLWREMEHDAGVKATEVTFNILFDAASKAGKFHLAEMIYKEMDNRGFSFNRYHHVSLIHFFGLKLDSNGVRAAYREMIEAGEMIDSSVLNCVIAGFIRSAEEDSALQVYEKMKASNEDLEIVPDLNYNLQKTMTRVLMMFAKVGREYPDMRPNFQKTALLAPDLYTYRILVNHYSVKLGDLAKVAQFLDEMKYFQVPVHGSIFLSLFKGFSIHAGPGSDWNAQRLDSIWRAFLEALDSDVEGLYISTWLGMAVLKAFSRYASREEMLNVYECLSSRWDLGVADSHHMLDYLRKVLSEDGRRGRVKEMAPYW